MRPGQSIAGRYVVEALAGAGGMGQVFRAHDDAGRRVAVKILAGAGNDARFSREARVLRVLEHPHIVRFLDDGLTEDGRPYLAMEWLEGESLHERLKRGRLSVASTIDLGFVVAGALGAAHDAGVVHRDLKPANIFLVKGRPSQAKILDFGIARVDEGETPLTRTGDMIGTIGFMAPEQARGDKLVTSRSDIFALGCVLYACVTGERPFSGEDPLTVLLKVTLDDPRRASELCPEVPEQLDDLIARMLSKNPNDRPVDGVAVMDELSDLRNDLSIGDATMPFSRLPQSRIGDEEQRLVSIVLAIPPNAEENADATVTVAPNVRADERAVRAVVSRHKGQAEIFRDGSALVTLGSSGAATDSAMLAARCALALRPLLPGLKMAVVSGRGVMSARAPMSDLIERAVALVRDREIGTELFLGGLPEPSPFVGIRIDERTAGLLDPTFDVIETAGTRVLRGVRGEADSSRPLLGRPTECVGRERELATLEALFLEAVTDHVARAALVVAGPGMGKSRLRHELMRRIGAGGEPCEIWTARGDPMRQGSSFAMLAQIVSRAAGINEGQPLATRLAKLRARVGLFVPPPEAPRVAELLGEMAGTKVPDDDASEDLLALRRDPLSMSEPMRRAWETFLVAECDAHPVVLVLEDLHWGDVPTVAFVEAALRVAADRPFFVLALARPEVHVALPGLFRQHAAQEIRLSKLTRRAAERLVRGVLGDAADPVLVATIVEHADGNPFYLEEMIRASVEGREGATPETVLSMVQARIEALEPEARKVLRAASVFGQVFWREGVEAISRDVDAGTWLARLVEREWISQEPEDRLPDQEVYKFRHDLVRDAAYAMLTERDLRIAHRIAGAWLTAAGETDPATLAEHFERGGEPTMAAAWYRTAAERALFGNDLDAAVACAQKGIGCGAQGELRSQLATLAIEAHGWRNDWTSGAAHADELLASETPGSRPWCMAAAVRVWSAPLRGQLEGYVETIQLLHGVTAAPNATGELVQALCAVVMSLTIVSAHDIALSYLLRTEEIGAPLEAADHASRGWMNIARGYRARQMDGAVHTSLAFMRAAMDAFEKKGNPHQRKWASVQAAIDWWLLGKHAEAVFLFRGALGTGGGEKRYVLDSLARIFLASALTDAIPPRNIGSSPPSDAASEERPTSSQLGSLEEAESHLDEVIAAESERNNLFFEGMARSALAEVLRRRGDLPRAEEEARRAIDRLSAIPFDQAVAKSRLSTILLDQGNPEDALKVAVEATSFFAMSPGYGASWGELAHAEALLALGERDAARNRLRKAGAALRARAEAIEDPSLLVSFLESDPRHARLLALVRSESDRTSMF